MFRSRECLRVACNPSCHCRHHQRFSLSPPLSFFPSSSLFPPPSFFLTPSPPISFSPAALVVVVQTSNGNVFSFNSGKAVAKLLPDRCLVASFFPNKLCHTDRSLIQLSLLLNRELFCELVNRLIADPKPYTLKPSIADSLASSETD